MVRIHRKAARLALLAGVSALVALPAAPALAAGGSHTVTITNHQHGTWTETGDTNPCNGDSIDVTVTGNAVDHTTFFTGSDEFWGTFTETGTGMFTDRGVVYNGRFTVWGNFNLNRQNANTTFTFSLRFTGSDGSVVSGHETMHASWLGDPAAPPTLSFDKTNFTCG